MTDSYVRHISHKYRLAIALAVLREKPDDVSIEQYLERLRNKINSDRMDDLDITLCSDDFDLDIDETNNDIVQSQDTEMIIKEHTFNTQTDDKLNGISHSTSNTQDSIKLLEGYSVNDTQTDRNDTQILDELTNPHSNDKPNNINKTSQESISLLKDVVLNKDGIDKTNNNVNLAEHTNINTDIEDKQHQRYPKINDSRLYNNQTNIYSQNIEKINVTYCDSQIIYNDSNNYKQQNVLPSTNTEISNANECIHNTQYINESQTSKKEHIQDLTQNFTHVSQSQSENIVIDHSLLKSKSKDAAKELTNKDNPKADSNEGMNDMEIDEVVVKGNPTFTQHGQDLNLLSTQNTPINELVKETNELVTTKSQELISFKVIEELNKVKNYLNRRDDRRISNDGSIDSGYKSDSQIKSLKSSLQTGNWLNQSAHSLFDYVMESSIIETTREITNEISKVLAQLVDRLHEEEKYLSFLDEFLDNIDKLIQELLDGDNCDQDILLRKDEVLNRLLLINRSSHIQKYTIEKLTSILDNVYTHISNPEEIYEISNICYIENLSYIFHILEIILQRYVESKKLQTNNSSSSQGELKKSSIVNIWRKKWYPHSEQNVDSEEVKRKKCVLLKCNEVLNKIVVNCMEGYSLLSFAALQCFNLLQS